MSGPYLSISLSFFILGLGSGLITRNESPQWREQRQFIHNTLRDIRATNNNFEDIVSSTTGNLLEEVARTDGKLFDPNEYIHVTVANNTTSIVMGIVYKYDDAEFIRMTKLVDAVFAWMGPAAFLYHVPLLANLPLPVNRKGDFVIKNMMDFLAEVVERHRRSFAPENKPKDVIDSYLKEQHRRSTKGVALGSFQDEGLLQLTWDLVLGGFETVSSSLRWFLLLMAKYAHVQAKVQAELDRVVGRDRLPSLSDKPLLPYTEAAIAECQRRYPIVPIHIPHGVRRDVKLRGYDIPKGTYIATNSWKLAMSRDEWGDPEAFRPERFLVGEGGVFDRKLDMKLVVFGVGRRVCPGEQLARTELFVIFTHLLHRFTFEVPEGTSLEGKMGLAFAPLPYQIRALAR